MSWINELAWGEKGLLPAIACEFDSGRVLTLAWMNAEALTTTVAEERAVYWSRSRQRLWRKGEESGHVQKLVELQIDCDADALLLLVEQIGGIACHTGRHSCFYRRLENGQWVDLEVPIKDPTEIYQKGS